MSAAPSSAARKLFGTDGVRGVAGEFLSAELALALARAATARVQTDGRPARVLIIRDTRESGEMLEAAVAAGVAAAGGEALLGGILPTPGAPLLIASPRLRPGRGPVGLAQPVPGQRDQVLRRRRLQAQRRHRGRDRGRARAAAGRPGAPGSRAARSTARSRTTCARSQERFSGLDLTRPPDPARLRQRRHVPRRAGDLPPPRRRHRRHRARARRAQHQPQLRLDAPRPPAGRRCRPATTRSASRSTATATACSPWTATARSSTATS